MSVSNVQPLVVTTKHRGVFFGYADPASLKAKRITLKNARCAVYWSAESKGVLGLSAIGPQKGSRIGFACPSLTLEDVTAVMETTEEAAANWEKAPWS